MCSIFACLPQAFVPEFSVLFQFSPRLQLCNVKDQGTKTGQRLSESKLPKVWKSQKPRAMRKYAKSDKPCRTAFEVLHQPQVDCSQPLRPPTPFRSLYPWRHVLQDVKWINMIQAEQTYLAGVENMSTNIQDAKTQRDPTSVPIVSNLCKITWQVHNTNLKEMAGWIPRFLANQSAPSA